MLGRVIVSCIMPWRSSFPCHAMGCAVDPTLFCGLLYLSFGLLI